MMKSKSTFGRTLFAAAMIAGAMSAFATTAQAGEWRGHKNEKHRGHQKHYAHNHYRPVVVHRPIIVQHPRVVYYTPQPVFAQPYQPWGWTSYNIIIR